MGTIPQFTFMASLNKICYIHQQLLAKQILNKGGCYIRTINYLGQNRIVKILGTHIHIILKMQFCFLTSKDRHRQWTTNCSVQMAFEICQFEYNSLLIYRHFVSVWCHIMIWHHWHMFFGRYCWEIPYFSSKTKYWLRFVKMSQIDENKKQWLISQDIINWSVIIKRISANYWIINDC